MFISYEGSANIAVSTDAGLTWPDSGKVVIDDGYHWNHYPDAHQSMGKNIALVVSGNNMYVSYYNSTSEDLMFARSLDGGQTW